MKKGGHFDLFVIGGGINGAAIARDATGRGLSVKLAEKNDYASATSSASSKLIHGGLRYLEQYKFSLVRQSLNEREVMMKIAPHLVTPLKFHIPIMAYHTRPAWFIRLGLFLYDCLAGHKVLARSGTLSHTEMAKIPHLQKEELTHVLHYDDCQVDDARLTLSTLLDARNRGADISNYCEVTSLQECDKGYKIKYNENNALKEATARFVVNTAGPWVNDLNSKITPTPRQSGVRLIRGSHIVLAMPQPAHRAAHTLQNSDGRVIFTLPWLGGKFLVIGTTDASHKNMRERPECSAEERDYLLDIYNRNFVHPGGPAQPKDIIWTWSGVRSLADDKKSDPSKVTRSARIITSKTKEGGLISVYGGKLTTHRRLAEKVMKRLISLGAEMGPSWTANSPLYGGEKDRHSLEKMAETPPKNIDSETYKRWVFCYGTRTDDLIAQLKRKKIGGILETELNYAFSMEDARTSDDFLFRRTKCGLFLSKDDHKAIRTWFNNKRKQSD